MFARDMSAFAGFRFPPEAILLAARWYLRYGLSYGDLEELLAISSRSVSVVPGRREGRGRSIFRLRGGTLVAGCDI